MLCALVEAKSATATLSRCRRCLSGLARFAGAVLGGCWGLRGGRGLISFSLCSNHLRKKDLAWGESRVRTNQSNERPAAPPTRRSEWPRKGHRVSRNKATRHFAERSQFSRNEANSIPKPLEIK